MNAYFIGVDIGGTKIKSALYDQSGNEIYVSSSETDLLTPRVNHTEREMEQLFDVVCQTIKEISEEASNKGINDQIKAIACSGHGKGLYLWGEDNKPVYNGILSTDTRAASIVDLWKQNGIDDKVYDKTYQDILVSQPCALLKWFKDNLPDAYKRIKYVFEAKDYVRYRLTGKAFAEITDYSGTNLINLKSKNYDQDLFELFDIPEMFYCMPSLIRSDEAAGYLLGNLSQKLNLDSKVIVGGGLFDIDACAIASGLIDESSICSIAGTWSINEFISSSPITDHSIAMNSIYCLPEYYLIEESSPTSAGNFEWLINSLFVKDKEDAEFNQKSIYKIVDDLVSQTYPDESDLLFLPFIFGGNEKSTDNGAFIGLRSNQNKKLFWRAVFEGIVFSHKYHIDKLLKNRTETKSIKFSGGAAHSRVWSQIFADIIDLPIEVVRSREPGALGAAMCAAVASGHYPNLKDAAKAMSPESIWFYPNDQHRKTYDEKYQNFLDVINKLYRQ